MEERKMFALCLLGRNPEGCEDPVVRFGFDRKDVFEASYPFFVRDGGILCEITNFDVDTSFTSPECVVEMKNGVPYKLIYRDLEDESEFPENFIFANIHKI